MAFVEILIDPKILLAIIAILFVILLVALLIPALITHNSGRIPNPPRFQREKETEKKAKKPEKEPIKKLIKEEEIPNVDFQIVKKSSNVLTYEIDILAKEIFKKYYPEGELKDYSSMIMRYRNDKQGRLAGIYERIQKMIYSGEEVGINEKERILSDLKEIKIAIDNKELAKVPEKKSFLGFLKLKRNNEINKSIEKKIPDKIIKPIINEFSENGKFRNQIKVKGGDPDRQISGFDNFERIKDKIRQRKTLGFKSAE